MRRCSFIEICCLRQQTRDDKKLRKPTSISIWLCHRVSLKVEKVFLFYTTAELPTVGKGSREIEEMTKTSNLQVHCTSDDFLSLLPPQLGGSLRLFALPVLCSGEQGNKLGVEDTRTFFGEHIKMLTVRVSSTFLSLPKSSRSRFPL